PDFHLVQPQTSLFDDSVTHVSLLTHGVSSLSPFAWALRTRGRFGRLLLIMGINRTLYVVTPPQSQHHVDGLRRPPTRSHRRCPPRSRPSPVCARSPMVSRRDVTSPGWTSASHSLRCRRSRSIISLSFVDLFILRRQRLDIRAMDDSRPGSPYHYTSGFNLV